MLIALPGPTVKMMPDVIRKDPREWTAQERWDVIVNRHEYIKEWMKLADEEIANRKLVRFVQGIEVNGNYTIKN